MITLDSSALVSIASRRDANHQRVRNALGSDPGPYIVPVSILSEATYLIERGLPSRVLHAFLELLGSDEFQLDCGEQDFPQIRELIGRYADFPLGFSDAAVMACARRNGGRVLTLDLRHFGVVAREGWLTVLPE